MNAKEILKKIGLVAALGAATLAYGWVAMTIKRELLRGGDVSS